MKNRDQIIEKLVADVEAAKENLKRTPEPRGVTDSADSVFDYDQIMNTNMTVNYAAGMDYLHRIRNELARDSKRQALDLCSGPGHFTFCLAEYLGYKKILGIDYSQPMIDVSKKNNRAQKSEIEFVQMDALKLEKSGLKTGQFDLVRFANSAHHFDSIDDVKNILTASEKLCRDDGLVFLTDLCRLPNADVTRRFVELTSVDYRERGMSAMHQDFLNSMFAAWTIDEMAKAVPKNTRRVWYQIRAAALPYFQVLVGLPVGRNELFLRPSKEWKETSLFRSESSKLDWELTQPMYYSGIIREIARPKVGKKVA
jgi:2-polyprenyl-3-methyl-5-hydroxy-6-metoxy-1,4-benzoquinol methylase